MSGKAGEIGLSVNWVKKPGNCEPCKGCGEPIYGNRYNLELHIVTKTEATDINLCESCYLETLKPEA